MAREQRIMLLTGASRGIGHATVKTFEEQGWRILTVSRQAFSAQCPWLSGQDNHIQGRPWRSGGDRRACPPGARPASAAAPTILSRMLLILSSRYLGFMPLAFAAPWSGRGDIREIAIPGSRGADTCYLVHRRAHPPGLGGSIFRRMILDEFEPWRTLKDAGLAATSSG